MDKNYWVNVYKCRKEILKLARNPECFCWGYDVDFIFGWYCDEIVANGGIGIKLINGVPFELYTHLGKVGIFSEINTCFCDNKEMLIKKLQADYGIVLIPEVRNLSRRDYLVGQVYAITKLPWTSEPLPVFQYKTPEEEDGGFAKRDSLCNEIEKIYNPCKKDKFLEKRRIEDDWLVADDVRREFYKLGISIPREKKHGENEFHTKYHVPYYKI